MSSTQPAWYQLRAALEDADFAVASSLVDKDASLLHERNGMGESVLHFLAVENNRPAVEWLHARGSDLNAANKFGTPLLFEVAQLGHRELVLWLLAHGADPTMKDAPGRRVVHYLAESGKPEMVVFIQQHIASSKLAGL